MLSRRLLNLRNTVARYADSGKISLLYCTLLSVKTTKPPFSQYTNVVSSCRTTEHATQYRTLTFTAPSFSSTDEDEQQETVYAVLLIHASIRHASHGSQHLYAPTVLRSRGTYFVLAVLTDDVCAVGTESDRILQVRSRTYSNASQFVLYRQSVLIVSYGRVHTTTTVQGYVYGSSTHNDHRLDK